MANVNTATPPCTPFERTEEDAATAVYSKSQGTRVSVGTSGVAENDYFYSQNKNTKVLDLQKFYGTVCMHFRASSCTVSYCTASTVLLCRC